MFYTPSRKKTQVTSKRDLEIAAERFAQLKEAQT